MEKAAVFKEIYDNYIADVAALDLNRVGHRLGIEIDGDAAVIPFYGRLFYVSPRGVLDARGQQPSHAVSVILCKYLLLCPAAVPETGDDWVKYQDFKDALPFAGGFRNTAEKPISTAYSGRLEDLKHQCAASGGQPGGVDIACDLAVRFKALPQVDLLMLFNDRDDEFPADCSLLFQRRAAAYLDMECLAMLGMVLAVWLKDGPGHLDGNI